MKSICIFAGSNLGTHPDYKTKSERARGIPGYSPIRACLWSSRLGLMGEIADAVLKRGGQVTGVMPKGLFRGEVVHRNLTKLIEVEGMHERKAKMNELADGFIALPGGLGTFEELFEVWCWSQIGIHQKPIGLFNIAHYFDPLVELVHNSIEAGFANNSNLKLMNVSAKPEQLLEQMNAYRPPVMENKWKQLD